MSRQPNPNNILAMDPEHFREIDGVVFDLDSYARHCAQPPAPETPSAPPETPAPPAPPAQQAQPAPPDTDAQPAAAAPAASGNACTTPWSVMAIALCPHSYARLTKSLALTTASIADIFV